MQADPRNRGFTWPERRGPFRVVTDAQAEQWNRDGYFLMEGALDPALVDDQAAEIDPYEEKLTAALMETEDGRIGISRAAEITFTIHLVKKSEKLKAFTTSKLFAELCLDLIGDSACLYWDQAVYKKPETPMEFPWHQDNGYTFVEPQDYLTCWVPLMDTTIQNGCPWVMPGVHRGGTLRHWQTPHGLECLESGEGAVAVPAKKGDIVVFSSLTPHRTGPNLSDGMRKAYIVQYSHDNAVAYPRPDAKELFKPDPTRQFIVARDGEPVFT